jgi:hypothetical protein
MISKPAKKASHRAFRVRRTERTASWALPLWLP